MKYVITRQAEHGVGGPIYFLKDNIPPGGNWTFIRSDALLYGGKSGANWDADKFHQWHMVNGINTNIRVHEFADPAKYVIRRFGLTPEPWYLKKGRFPGDDARNSIWTKDVDQALIYTDMDKAWRDVDVHDLWYKKFNWTKIMFSVDELSLWQTKKEPAINYIVRRIVKTNSIDSIGRSTNPWYLKAITDHSEAGSWTDDKTKAMIHVDLQAAIKNAEKLQKWFDKPTSHWEGTVLVVEQSNDATIAWCPEPKTTTYVATTEKLDPRLVRIDKRLGALEDKTDTLAVGITILEERTKKPVAKKPSDVLNRWKKAVNKKPSWSKKENDAYAAGHAAGINSTWKNWSPWTKNSFFNESICP